MADYTVSNDVDTLMQAADKAAMRAAMDVEAADIKTLYESNADTNAFTDAEQSKLSAIEASAEVNNISDADATDLTDGGESTLHYHAADRDRANHTGSQTLSTISDAGTAASKDFPAAGDAGAAEVVLGDDSRLTDARTPTSHTHTASDITDFDTEVSNNTDVAANTSKLSGIESGAEVNNISDTNATDLTDGGDSTLHYHSADRNRANHTGSQTLSTISDAGTIASQNANAVTITGGSITGITDLAVADGGTGSGTAAGARTNLEVYSDAEVDANVATKAVAGGVELDGAAGVITTTLDAGSLFSGPFTVTWWMSPTAAPSSNSRVLQLGTSNQSVLNAASSTLFQLFLNTDSTDGRYEWPYPQDYGTWHHYALYIDPSDITSPQLYKDGELLTRSTQTTPTGNVSVPSGNLSLGGPTVFNPIQVKSFLSFNRALSAAEVADLYESGTVAVADRWGSVAGQTSGTLVVGKRYRITTFVAGDSFTNVGAASNASGVEFIATGTNPTTWTNGSTLTPVGAIADLPLDEGIGYQHHDRSSNHFDALASTTGVTHLVPKQSGKVRVKAADASSAMYMLRADSILPTDSIISNVLSEQCYVDLSNSAQVLDDYRIRLNPSGSDLQIQRSDGSNHATLGTVTAPSSLSDVDVQIHYEQVAQ